MDFFTQHTHLGVIPTLIVDIGEDEQPTGETYTVFDPLIGRRDLSSGQSIIVPYDSDGPAMVIETYQIISLN